MNVLTYWWNNFLPLLFKWSHVLVRVLQRNKLIGYTEVCREIHYEGLDHRIMEADKSYSLGVNWRPGKQWYSSSPNPKVWEPGESCKSQSNSEGLILIKGQRSENLEHLCSKAGDRCPCSFYLCLCVPFMLFSFTSFNVYTVNTLCRDIVLLV